MGRKIPGKKHRGVKDPQKQRTKRFNSVKGKINVPPSDPDLQEVPHSVKRIADLQQQMKDKNYHKRPKITERHKKTGKKEPQFKQRNNESDKQFLQRVKRACSGVIQENAFENKYKVDILRNPETGEVEKLVKKPKDELEELAKKAQKESKMGKGKKGKKRKAEPTEPRLTKSQKRQRKLTERKQRKAINKDLNSRKDVDVVKFGEVVHAPPTLTAPKRVEKSNCAPRPGQKNLLLKSVLQQSQGKPLQSDQKQQSKTENKLRKTSNKAIDKTGKRKNLPNALRRKLENQQTEIINAYRMLKQQKNKSISV